MRSGEEHRFTFDDAAAARRGEALLRLAVTNPTAKERAAIKREAGLESSPPRLSSQAALQRLLRDHPDEASIEDITRRDNVVEAVLMLHDDIDVEAEGETPPSAKLSKALERFVGELGGLCPAELEARARFKERKVTLASATSSGPDLLARLEAVKDQLLRFEKVFLDTLRTSASAGAILDGQRLEALAILKRVEGVSPPAGPAAPP